MQAIISDIHSNQEALEAVLRDIEKKGIKEIICLGDIIGYGPDPKICLDHIRNNCDVIICGNHDAAVIHEPIGFNWVAAQAIEWTRKQLKPDSMSLPWKNQIWKFLHRLPCRYDDGDVIYTHGSPRFPLDEYIHEMDTLNNDLLQLDYTGKLKANFEMIKGLCFIGHTHRPGIITEDFHWHSLDEMNYEFKIGSERLLVNVGSVGQPRDSDTRSCYVTFDGETIRYQKVEYDFRVTMEKIRAIDDLNNLLAERLAVGG
jgi:predicted phosphodiesterase